MPAKQLRKAMKKTKETRRLLAKSKFIESEYEADKEKLIEKYFIC